MRLSRWVALCLFIYAARAGADDISGGIHDITDVSLDDLLKTDVDVATKVPQTFRETPGVITVLTREEIMDSGARDLEDVLLMVPGFSLGIDVEGITDVGVRGNWGHEGKVLLLIDGQQMNETLYSTNQFGNHYPVDQIERVEIIRGPGSAIYGGNAELAVINVITRGADELHGAAVYGSAGFMGSDPGHENLSLAVGDKAGPVKISASLLLGQGARSNAPFTDFYQTTYPLTDARMNPAFLNIGVRYGDLSARFIYDHYRADEQDGLASNETMQYKQLFIGYYGEVKYELRPMTGLLVTPKINYTRQTPWEVSDPTSQVAYDKTAQRLTAGSTASYEVQKNMNVLAGAEVYWDNAFLNPAVPPGSGAQLAFDANNGGMSNDVTYYNEAVYAQGLWNNEWANVTVGARYEHNSQFGSSFVPRIAVTKLFEPFHIKVLYSEAFRAPSFEDINSAPTNAAGNVVQVQPEHTRVGEAEFGYSIDAHNFVTVNAFYTRIAQPIVYFVDPTVAGGQGYTNFPVASTAGFEADYKARYGWGYVDVNYSYYRALANEVPLYQVAATNPDGTVVNEPSVMLGMPNHKISLHGAYKIWKDLRFAPSMIVQLGQWAYANPSDGAGTGTLKELDTTVLLNAFLSYHDLGVKGVEAGIGVYNALDRPLYYAQPYNGGHAPLQGATRELLLRVGYTKPF